MSEEKYPLEIALEEKPVEMICKLVEMGVNKWGNALSDHWKVTLKYDNYEFTTDFYQGIVYRGLKAKIPYSVGQLIPKEREFINKYKGKRFNGANFPTSYCERWLKKNDLIIPIEPKVESVMYCLLNDSTALNELYEDWCDNYGFDTDSIKAKETFDQCNDIGKHMKRLLGSDFEFFIENNEY